MVGLPPVLESRRLHVGNVEMVPRSLLLVLGAEPPQQHVERWSVGGMVLEACTLEPLCLHCIARGVALAGWCRDRHAEQRQGFALAHAGIAKIQAMRAPVAQGTARTDCAGSPQSSDSRSGPVRAAEYPTDLPCLISRSARAAPAARRKVRHFQG